MTVKRILAVDDSRADLANIEDILKGARYEVFEAGSGREAIDKARALKPDLIFMDVMMSEMDGFQATREILKDPALKHIPVVFVTSKCNKADRVWAQMVGGKALVCKPYTADEILRQADSVAP
jgi:twitching motility two-component system response regulator PilH